MERNFNPFYNNDRYIADINLIIKELHKHETKILQDHKDFIELNKVTMVNDINNNNELKEDILNFIKSKEEYVNIANDIKYINITSHSFTKNAMKLNEKVLFTAIVNRQMSIVVDMRLVEYVFRSYLYTMCKAIAELALDNVYYFIGNRKYKLHYFFIQLLKELDEEFEDLKSKNASLSPTEFLIKYDKYYKNYINKHILTKDNFKVM